MGCYLVSGEGKGTPANKPRTRTQSRAAAVQALFQSEASGENPETVIDQFVRHRLGEQPRLEGFDDGQIPQADVPLFTNIVRGAAKNGAKLDAIIGEHLAANWPLERLDPVLRALLRAAAAELSMGKDPPARVVINEYLDIAHGFLAEDGPRFANGVLDALARHLRGAEFTGQAR
ncbi:transcription antitermination factor NusB [Acetobacteraceae bacterium H6797]|nr:transcription antitermination factor NusB [Acetobacteraceae bacterium H6797]